MRVDSDLGAIRDDVRAYYESPSQRESRIRSELGDRPTMPQGRGAAALERRRLAAEQQAEYDEQADKIRAEYNDGLNDWVSNAASSVKGVETRFISDLLQSMGLQANLSRPDGGVKVNTFARDEIREYLQTMINDEGLGEMQGEGGYRDMWNHAMKGAQSLQKYINENGGAGRNSHLPAPGDYFRRLIRSSNFNPREYDFEKEEDWGNYRPS